MEKLNWNDLENGVYAVVADGTPVMVEDADESCIAVALIVNDAPTPQRIMIAKEDATDGVFNLAFWGFELEGYNISGIANYSQTGGGGAKSFGCLPKPDGTYIVKPKLSGDYATWMNGVLSDFSGKVNTSAIIKERKVERDMATWCSKFNETPSENQGFNDWYIPSMGQLALMYLNKTAINEALTKIGGLTFASNRYWSSSQFNCYDGYNLNFYYGELRAHSKICRSRVRFVRDI